MAKPGSSPRNPKPCNAAGCEGLIWFRRVGTDPRAKPMPLDAEPADDGNIAAAADRSWIPARVTGPGEPLADGERLWMPHWRTCTSPAAFRRRQQAARPVREPGDPAQLALIPATGDDPR